MSDYHQKKILKCNKCNQKKTSDNFYYNRSRKKYMSSCKKCNTKTCNDYRKTKNTDLGFLTQRRATEIKRRCKHRDIVYDDNLKDILRECWEKQKGLCYYTGLPMVCSNEYHTRNDVFTVDRIEPSNGYVRGNIVLCQSIVNKIKQDLSLEELKNICKSILEYN